MAHWNTAVGDEEPADAELLAELLSTDLRRMMLVDVAFVDELTRSLQSPGALDRVLRELAGLGLVERLRGDLLTVAAQAKRRAPRGQEPKQLEAWTQRLREIDDSLEQTRNELETLQSDAIETEESISLKERELYMSGGELADNRPVLREALAATEAELERATAELRDLCQGTLPFALCPSMCLEVAEQLDREADTAASGSLSEIASEWLDQVSSDLIFDKTLREIVPDKDARNAAVERMKTAALDSLTIRRHESAHQHIHDLSERDRTALVSWITESMTVIPDKAKALASALGQLELTRDHAVQELDRVPNERGLRAAQDDLRSLREQLLRTNADLVKAQAQLDALENERLALLSEMRALEEELTQRAESDRVDELIHRTRLALDDFESAQLERRAGEFSRALVGVFNAMSRKQSLLTSVQFDPKSRMFAMAGVDGDNLDIAKLSTGELQIYSMAVLESLRATARRQLPLLVDTPLAYLDELHRETFLSSVLLGAERQVVLFATDQEMDGMSLERWLPEIEFAYALQYDAATRSSSVTPLATQVKQPSSAEQVA
jgi:DNA sulfur modification protein DndD